MAFVEKLPSGRWRGGHWVKTYDGKRRKHWVEGTFERKTDAREAAQESEVKARRTASVESGTASARITWGEWWEIYSSKRQFVSAHERVKASMVRTHLGPRWGDVPLNQLHRRDIQEWVDGLVRAGYSPSYVRGLFATLRASVREAVHRDMLSTDPSEGVRLPRISRRARVHTTLEDVERMRPYLPDVHADALLFLLETGLRPGELAGLHVNRVDLDEGWLMVAEVYVDRRNIIRPIPKDGDVRTVPLTSRAISIARRQLERRTLLGGCGIPHSDGAECRQDLLFRNKRGGPLRPLLLGNRIREAAIKAGLPTRGGYSGRRGFATRAAAGGMDAFLLAEVMGHADVRVTREYVQQGRDSRARALAALGEVPGLSVVEPVGQRGTERGTDLGNQSLRSTTFNERGNSA